MISNIVEISPDYNMTWKLLFVLRIVGNHLQKEMWNIWFDFV